METNVSDFEKIVLAQNVIQGASYDEHYFTGEWRQGGNDYSLETRRRIEGKNPANIKEVFEPKCALDLGCGPGALMQLLHEIDVDCYGIDFSEGAKKVAPPTIVDKIHVGSVTDYFDFGGKKFDLVICRELLEHLTILQIRQTVANMAALTTRFVYVTTRFHPNPDSLLAVTDDKVTDPTHITVLNKDFLRLLFVLEGMRRREDLEQKLDWKNYGRVLVYEKPSQDDLG
jgi:SAM-dependent methyltransferase